jgi:hypothetical protein
MATKKAKTKVVTESVTLEPSVLKRISNVLSDSYGAKDASGATVASDLCSKLKPLLPKEGKVISDAGLEVIMASLKTKRNWSADTTKSRKTEIKAILQCGRNLAGTVSTFAESNNGICGWNAVVGLARKLAAGDAPAEAVKAQLKGGSAGKAIKTREDATKWVALQLKRIINAECMSLMPRGFVKDVGVFAAENSIKV